MASVCGSSNTGSNVALFQRRSESQIRHTPLESTTSPIDGCEIGSRTQVISTRHPQRKLYEVPHWELRLLGIAIGQKQVRIGSIAWMAFTKISALWEASCCCTLLVRDNIRSMHCAVLPRHNAFVPLAASHSSLLKHTARRILANREMPYPNWSRR